MPNVFLHVFQVETILQVLGSVGLVQFVSKKFLFAKVCISLLLVAFISNTSDINTFHRLPSQDRKQTVQQIDEVLNAKVGAKELVGDIQVLMLLLTILFLFVSPCAAD